MRVLLSALTNNRDSIEECTNIYSLHSFFFTGGVVEAGKILLYNRYSYELYRYKLLIKNVIKRIDKTCSLPYNTERF